MRLLNGKGTPADARPGFARAMILSSGLALLPSCATYAQIPLTETAPAAGQVPDTIPRSPAKPSCLGHAERKVVETALPAGGSARYVTLTQEVEVGDYAMPPDSANADATLRVVKITDESVGLSFLASRDSVWLLQYGQASTLVGPAGTIRATAELCAENKAKLIVTYQEGRKK